MGEHAVVYGRPALTAALDLRLTASFSDGGDGVRLSLPQVGVEETTSWESLLDYTRMARSSWEAFKEQPSPQTFEPVRGEDPAHVAKLGLGEVAEYCGQQLGRPLVVGIDSAIPIGAGFGSSAATCVAVIAGLMTHLGRDADPAAIDELARNVERRQHGFPSGVDHRTVLKGGVQWAVRKDSGDFAIETVTPASKLLSRLHVFHSGRPAESTGDVVAAVSARRSLAPERFEATFDRMAASTHALRELLTAATDDAEGPVEPIRAYQAGLEELGVVPEAVRRIVRRVEAAGGAAKVSGAGALSGPGAGCLVVYLPLPECIESWDFLAPLTHYATRLGAPGLFQEQAA